MVDPLYVLAGFAALTAASAARTPPALVVELSGFKHDRAWGSRSPGKRPRRPMVLPATVQLAHHRSR
jgi:hypothetical protein